MKQIRTAMSEIILQKSIDKETCIRAIVSMAVQSYAAGFATRHIDEYDDDEGVINMKIHNVFIAALGPEIQYYSALARSLDSSLGNMLEKVAIKIAELSYHVSKHVEGNLYKGQTDFIAELLEEYKRPTGRRIPSVDDYKDISLQRGDVHTKRHESDYYLHDRENDIHYLIELKIGGDLDNKKARSEKEALLEQYCILTNELGRSDNVKIVFATAYNRYGEGEPWRQGRVRQFFAEDELFISRKFWNLICKSDNGYDIVIDEYVKNAHYINEALDKIKEVYLPNE